MLTCLICCNNPTSHISRLQCEALCISYINFWEHDDPTSRTAYCGVHSGLPQSTIVHVKDVACSNQSICRASILSINRKQKCITMFSPTPTIRDLTDEIAKCHLCNALQMITVDLLIHRKLQLHNC